MSSKKQIETAFKYDGGKPRMDLLDSEWMIEVAKVLTVGSAKYDQSQKVFQNNWRQGGMRWGQVYAALQRHLMAFWSGEEIDGETGLSHLAHASCNTMFLHYYARNARHLDDRDLKWRKNPRIFLDIDGVLADWNGAMVYEMQNHYPHREFQVDDNGIPLYWNWLDSELWYEFRNTVNYDEFMARLDRLVDPKDWKFEPTGYVTHRGVDNEISALWLEKNGFPAAECHTVEVSRSKSELLMELNCDVFVDDKFDTFVEVNDVGILCYLWDAPWNRKYDVGSYRITDLNEIIT